ncbi:MAG: serine protease [Bacteroidota bacterium]
MTSIYIRMITVLLLLHGLSSSGWAQTQRVIDGEDAPKGAYPWMAGLLSNPSLSPSDAYFCGAILIDSRWALTAAHCLDDFDSSALSNVELFVGSNDLSANASDYLRLPIAQVIRHPDYSLSTGFEHDLALLRLDQDLAQDPIRLPTAAESFLADPGIPCMVLGWGIQDTNFLLGPLLQQADVELIATDECNRMDRYNGRVTANMLCAGKPNSLRGSAKGDSGGPLMVFYDNQWYGVGLVSWGQLEWSDDAYPGVYQNLSRYEDWIRRTIAQTTSTNSPSQAPNTQIDIRIFNGKLWIENKNVNAPFNSYRLTVADLLGRTLLDQNIQLDVPFEMGVHGLPDCPFIVSLWMKGQIVSRIFVKS